MLWPRPTTSLKTDMNFALIKRQRVSHPTSLSKTRLRNPARLIPRGPTVTVSMPQSPAAVASAFSNSSRSECRRPMCALHRGASNQRVPKCESGWQLQGGEIGTADVSSGSF